MARLKAVTKANADAKSRKLLEGVEKKLGMVPNLMRTMANSPAVLDAYLAFSNALAEGALPIKLREQIALTVGETNQCEYCVAAHSALGRMAGLTEEELSASRRGSSASPKTATALAFVRKVVEERGHVGDADLARLYEAGYGEGDIAELVGNVAINLFTNYFNHVAGTEVDFPRAPALCGSSAQACAA